MNCFVLLVVVIISSSGATTVSTLEKSQPDFLTKAIEGTTPASPHSVTGGNKLMSVVRALSISDAGETDKDNRGDIPENEERLFELSNGVSKLAHLVSSINPTAQKLAFRLWLEVGTNPKDVFKLLNLKQLVRAATKLDDNPTLLEWLRYSVAYREKHGGDHLFQDGEIYLMLAKRVPEAEVATFFQSLKSMPDLKVLGENLQKTQYFAWWNTGVELKQVEKMLEITDSTKTLDPKNLVYLGYVQVWLGNTRIVL
ncbi:hypothetical protein ON010_g3478 [Phytophthora cinnamomi]|nr:hypothetical protein ON010_g3478 [Phytophthora cinnamomi]